MTFQVLLGLAALVAAAAAGCSQSGTGGGDGGETPDGSVDAGTARDAGGVDAGVADAGGVDAGGTDAGTPDSGMDAGCFMGSAGSTVLLGEPCIEPVLDGVPEDGAQAFAFTAADAGTSGTAYIYIYDMEPPGLQIQLGVYADNGSNAPGGLIFSAWITAPVAGAWNSVSFPFATLVGGTQYWLAIHCVSSTLGGVGIYDDYSMPGATPSYGVDSTGSLPATWPLASSTPELRGPVTAFITN